jgi:uncharacterized membrane protein YgdD (TMEM256/DUF423 family)
VKCFILLGSLNMALAIAIGAFGAHGLKGKISENMLNNWNTGAHYHLLHGVALLVIGLLIAQLGAHGDGAQVAGWLLFAGIVLFSGSLYVMALTGVKVLGAITPIGGLAFIVGWIWLTVTAWRHLS